MTQRTLTFQNGVTPLDLLLYQTYGREVAGLVEATLAANPGLAALGPYPPMGTKVVVTDPAPNNAANVTPVIRLFN